MNKATAVAFLVIGIMLLVFGYNSYNSAGSGVSEVVTGSPTAKAIWLLIGGFLATIIGGANLARR